MKNGYSHGGVVERLIIPDGDMWRHPGETLISKEAYENLKRFQFITTWKRMQQDTHSTFFTPNSSSWDMAFNGIIMWLSKNYREEYLALKDMNRC